MNNNKFKSNVDIDCLLPNGLLITLNLVEFDSSLKDILNKINEQVTLLYDISISYNDLIITSVDTKSQIVEFYDLDKKLCDLNIFQDHLFLKLVNNESLDFNAKYIKFELGICLKLNYKLNIYLFNI
jgi:hypothetical protein